MTGLAASAERLPRSASADPEPACEGPWAARCGVSSGSRLPIGGGETGMRIACEVGEVGEVGERLNARTSDSQRVC